MNAEAPISFAADHPLQQRVARFFGKKRLIRLAEIVALVSLIVMAGVTYFVVTGDSGSASLLTPLMVALLLIANLVPAMAIMVLIARRFALRRARMSMVGSKGRLHVRLVALFAVVASVPTIMVVVLASLLFQYGSDFWFSDRAKTVIGNAQEVARQYRLEQLHEVQLEVETMGADVVNWANDRGFDDPQFLDFLLEQTARRYLLESALLTIGEDGKVKVDSAVNLYDRPLEDRFSVSVLRSLKAGEARAKEEEGDRIEAVVRLDPEAPVYIYGARAVNPQLLRLAQDSQRAANEYDAVVDRSRIYQLRFNAALLIVSLIILGIVTWIALAVADRLVRPVGELVGAARQVAGGDLSARVPVAQVQDEVGILGDAFNRMTSRLEEQTGALISANRQIDSRRAFIEAVLSGVTAGIISVDGERKVSLINSSAEALLKTGGKSAVGQKLEILAPELDEQLDSELREDIIQFASHGEPRTLAVKRVRVENGHVITFDDITDQLADQRRAAWSDVARRIAHEIKNPLTPIQLAAERLQRRYGNEVQSDPSTFARLTSTIVRQVGDLRRMVDEFSSFARMPKPIFREEAAAPIASQALFLHEVAHPDIIFSLEAPDPSPTLVCDRRQLGQALTNVVKNGVEAIQQRRDAGELAAGEGRVTMRLHEDEGSLIVEIRDNGIGLPAERARITEPYMTTRTKGTGLGLAIVKKIVEEHFGRVEFEDAPGGGTLVRMVFDVEALGRLDTNLGEDGQAND